MLRLPMSRIAPKSENWPVRYSRSRVNKWSWLMWIRATQEKLLNKRPPSRYPTGSDQTYRGQTRLRAAAAKMGGGKKFCLGRTLSPFGSRLRTTRCYPRSFSFPRLCLPD